MIRHEAAAAAGAVCLRLLKQNGFHHRTSANQHVCQWFEIFIYFSVPLFHLVENFLRKSEQTEKNKAQKVLLPATFNLFHNKAAKTG